MPLGYNAPARVSESAGDVARLLDVADTFGEVTVIREVAYRAGVLWHCVCGTDNPTRVGACSDCTRPRP